MEIIQAFAGIEIRISCRVSIANDGTSKNLNKAVGSITGLQPPEA